MLAITRGDLVLILDKDGRWLTSDKGLKRLLNRHSKRITDELTPADGDPRRIVFNSVKEMFTGSEVIDTEEPQPVPDGVTP